jgi:DNA modification methylase
MINQIINDDYLRILKQIPDNYIDCVITDPPYGINYQNNYTHIKKEKIENDEEKFSYESLAKESFRLLKEDTAFYAFTSWKTYSDHYIQIKQAGFKMKEPLICQKGPTGTGDLYGSFQTNNDWIMFAHKGRFIFKETKLVKNKKAGSIPNKGRKPVPEFKQRLPSGWFGGQYPWSTENSSFAKENNIDHPTIKSVNFIQWLILLSTNEGDVVLDPFCGSGTTALACKNTNRKFICIDVNPRYCQIAQDRLKTC